MNRELERILQDWHHRQRHWAPNISWARRSAGFAGVGTSCWEDFEQEVESHQMRMVGKVWDSLPWDGRVVVSVEMGWLPKVATIRRDWTAVYDEAVGLLMDGLRREGVL